MDGKQLKNSILQWAIQGKLVPQNPKDEPASKLLERIAAIRHSEQSEESSKRSKKTSKTPTSRIYRKNGVWYEQIGNAEPKDISEDIPFEIPENWAWCRLINIVKHISAGGDKPEKCVKAPTEDCKIPIYSNGEFNEGLYGFTDVARVFEPSLTISGRGTIGYTCIRRSPYVPIVRLITIIPSDVITLEYLQRALSIMVAQAAGIGTSIPQLTVPMLSPKLIPLPPLAEQKRIVAKLEQVLPLADEYGAAQEQLDKLNRELPEALKKSILQQAIQGKLVPQNPKDEPAQKLLERIASSRHSEQSEESSKRSKKTTKNPISRIYCENGTWYEQIGNAEPKDISEDIPFEIPENWVWTRMGNIGSWGAGATPAKGNPAFYKDGVIPWLVTGELNNSIVTETKTKISKIALEKCSLRLCKPGDVLIAMYGATIGKLAIAGIELTTNQACCACSLYYDYNKYLFYFLMASKPDLIKRGEGGAQPNISKEKLVNYLIPLPPLAEQKRIVAKLEQLFKVL